MVEYLYRLEELPARPPPLPDMPRVRGHVDTLLPQSDGTLLVSGWMVLIDQPLDQIQVYLDGKCVSILPLDERTDIATFFPWLPHAAISGFCFPLALSESQRRGTARLDLVGCYAGERCGGMSQFVRSDVNRLPSAPEDLMYRVTHERDSHRFKVGGLKTFGEFLECLARHADLSRFRRALDWGCGCGRIAMYFLAIEDGPTIRGCDIDPRAVRWADEFLQRGAFDVIEPMPPTPYADAQFDLIVSYSVFTHLSRDVAHSWLMEMHRLLEPGGLFLATTHGDCALQFAHGSRLASFPSDGILDAQADDTLDDIAPNGYYRATFQSREYTLRQFGKYFKVLDYRECGANNLQDIILVQK